MGNIVMGLVGTIDDYKMDLTTDLGALFLFLAMAAKRHGLFPKIRMELG